jgi:hypothetical protein
MSNLIGGLFGMLGLGQYISGDYLTWDWTLLGIALTARAVAACVALWVAYVLFDGASPIVRAPRPVQFIVWLSTFLVLSWGCTAAGF